MSTAFEVGVPLAGGDPVELDAAKLAHGRTLVTGSSGSGKSYTCRVIAEHVGPQLPVIVLDIEGEYVTLREDLDLVVFGPTGDVPVAVPAAKAIARGLADLRASAVIDLSELRLEDQQRFVRDFIDGQVALPKRLWRPRLIILDEAHRMCPERTFGDSLASDAVRDGMTRGRKRSMGVVLACQRLAQLDKTCAGMAQNWMFGMTTVDTDLARVGRMLGLGKGRQSELRDLEAGQFYGFGPGFSHRGVELFGVREATTTHPEPGQQIRPPRPSAEMAAALDQLREAAEKAAAEQEEEKRPTVGEYDDDDGVDIVAPGLVDQLREDVSRLEDELHSCQSRLEAGNVARLEAAKILRDLAVKLVRSSDAPAVETDDQGSAAPQAEPPPAPERANGASRSGLDRRILVTLAQHDGLVLTKRRVAALTQSNASSGHFRKCVGRLTSAGWATSDGDGTLAITTLGGIEAGAKLPPIPTTEEVLAAWLSKIGGGLTARLFATLVSAYPKRVSHPKLAERTSSNHASGHFRKCMGRLRGAEIVVSEGGASAVAPWLFENV